MDSPRIRRPSQKVVEGNIIKSRQPPRCRICPNRPLKTQCSCPKRKKSNLILQAKNGGNPDSGPSPSSINPNKEFDINNIDPQLLNMAGSEENDIRPSISMGETNPNFNTTNDTNNHFSTTPFFLANNSGQERLSPALDVVVNQVDHGCNSAASPPLNVIEEDVNEEPDQTGSTNLSSPPKRPKINSKSAPFGHVEGVRRGNQPYTIPRLKQLRPKIYEISKSTTRYRRELPKLISRCERISEECDAYMVLLSQQANGSSATVHYTSPRLRREAKNDATKIVNEFQNLIFNLMRAKREDALQMAKQLDATRDQMEVAKSQAKQAEKQVLEREAELEAQAALIHQLEAKIQLLTGLSSDALNS